MRNCEEIDGATLQSALRTRNVAFRAEDNSPGKITGDRSMATPHQRRRIAKLKKDIEEIERHCFYFLLDVYPDDADAERYALESKRMHLCGPRLLKIISGSKRC